MDPIANMLIMLKNASLAGHKTIVVPFSKMKNSIAECLVKEGYVLKASKKLKKNHPVLELEIVYLSGNKPKINFVERISKQSRRVYIGAREIYPVRSGKGLIVLSTPKGILSGAEARKERVGGEALFKVW